MRNRTIDVAPVRVGDAREKDTRRCALCSKRLPNGHSFQYCASCMRRLDAGERPVDIMCGAKDHVTLFPVPDGTSEVRYTARDGAVLLEEYRGFKIKRAARSESTGKGAVIVEGLSNRPRYFTWWSEDGAVQLAKEAIDKYVGEKPAKDAEQHAKHEFQPGQMTTAWNKESRKNEAKPNPNFCKVCGRKKDHELHNMRPAKDSSLSTGLLAALIAAIVAHFYGPEERVSPQDYDLTRYRPKRREW